MAARDLNAAPPNISQLEAHDFDIEAARAEQFGKETGSGKNKTNENEKLSQKADEATAKALEEQQEEREKEQTEQRSIDETAPEKSTPAQRKAADDKK